MTKRTFFNALSALFLLLGVATAVLMSDTYGIVVIRA
jgi:hypothetical protein